MTVSGAVPVPQPAASARSTSTIVWAVGAVLSGVVLIAASFIPWLIVMGANGDTATLNGLEGGGDGVFTLLAGLVALGIGIAGFATTVRDAIRQIALIAVGALAMVIFFVDLPELEYRARSVGYPNTGIIGSGTYMLIVGGLVALVAGLVGMELRLNRLQHLDGPLAKWAAGIIGTIALLAILIPMMLSAHHDSIAGLAYTKSGLTLPSGMSRTAVADMVCQNLTWAGVDGAAHQLSASGGFDPDQSRVFVQTLHDSGYCSASN